MADMNNDQIKTLNSLISTTVDSINGFENSAKEIESQRLAQIFRERANERQQVVEQLRGEVRRLGGEPQTDGSFMGKTHQRWEDLKSAVTGGDEKHIIDEVERGEDYLKEQYEKVLKEGDLPTESRSVVERAYQKVREGHDQMSSLKHRMQTQG